MTDGGALRLFVAVELPEEIREGLRELMDALRTHAAAHAVRWVRPEGIHITLKFLGAVPAGRLDELQRALERATAGVAPFEFAVSGMGSFGGRRNVRVVWAGVGGETAALASLAARVEDEMAPLGFARESRPFAAHLTLGRVRDEATAAERESLHDAIAAARPPALPGVRVTSVSLMKSTLGRGGARYEALATFPLRG